VDTLRILLRVAAGEEPLALDANTGEPLANGARAVGLGELLGIRNYMGYTARGWAIQRHRYTILYSPHTVLTTHCTHHTLYSPQSAAGGERLQVSGAQYNGASERGEQGTEAGDTGGRYCTVRCTHLTALTILYSHILYIFLAAGTTAEKKMPRLEVLHHAPCTMHHAPCTILIHHTHALCYLPSSCPPRRGRRCRYEYSRWICPLII
jgi:hypothetical protein